MVSMRDKLVQESINKDNMYIVYASDNNFAEVMGISIMSLYENNRSIGITIYILDSGISELNKERIICICKKYNRIEPIWIQARNINEELGMKVQMDRGSLSQYARLFVSTLLPQDIERVLYLDCDTIINDSLSELWNLSLNGKTIAALNDAFSKLYRKNIGLKPNDVMFNSGVMLIDIKKWRENNVEEHLLRFIKEHNGMIQQGDQGALNAILSKDTYCMEPKFNSVTIFYDFTYEEMLIYRKPPKFYTKEEVKVAVEQPVIIHFTTSFLSRRPWVEGCQHRYKDKYLLYKSISPWKDEAIREYKTGQLKKLFNAFYNIAPTRVALEIAGWLQAYARPIINRIKMKK